MSLVEPKSPLIFMRPESVVQIITKPWNPFLKINSFTHFFFKWFCKFLMVKHFFYSFGVGYGLNRRRNWALVARKINEKSLSWNATNLHPYQIFIFILEFITLLLKFPRETNIKKWHMTKSLIVLRGRYISLLKYICLYPWLWNVAGL